MNDLGTVATVAIFLLIGVPATIAYFLVKYSARCEPPSIIEATLTLVAAAVVFFTISGNMKMPLSPVLALGLPALCFGVFPYLLWLVRGRTRWQANQDKGEES